MSLFTFSKPEKEIIIQKIRQYFQRELDQELGQFEAGFLLDFFAEEIGPHFYNRGIHDAHAILQKRVDAVIEAIESLEKPLAGRR
ncbi:MAG TPA: DUF2164 domain-containing protein [Bacteroidota bacterium]|nr:DUF2164 domain-containing protein [Bacteroidota bacterium]